MTRLLRLDRREFLFLSSLFLLAPDAFAEVQVDDPALLLFRDKYLPNLDAAKLVRYRDWRRQNPREASKWDAFRDVVLAGQQTTPPDLATPFGKMLVAVGEMHMSITHFVGSPVNPFPPPDPAPPPASSYTYRFATFNTTTDAISATLNRWRNPDWPANMNWWVVGTPKNGTDWPGGGGLYEISTVHGPGIRIVMTDEQDYLGVSNASDVCRFAVFHETANFRGQKHVWEWTWHWPSAGNPSGWANDWLTGEGLTLAMTGPLGNTIGHHLFINYASPTMSVRFGRQDFSNISNWFFTFGPSLPADTYVHFKLEIYWTETTAGYIRVSTDNGSGMTQWVNYSGQTMPVGWNVWTVYQNLRRVEAFNPDNTLDWINHRLTIL